MELSSATLFIGREQEKTSLKQFLLQNDVSLLQLFGLPYIGKTHLVRKVLEEFKHELHPPQEIRIDCVSFSRQDLNSIREKYLKIYSTNNDKNCQLCKNISIFDDFHLLNPRRHEEFLHFLSFLLSSRKNMKFILISSHWKPLALCDNISWTECRLLSLTASDSRQLFYKISGAVASTEADICIDFIAALCNFRPGLLIALAKTVSKHLAKFSLEDICSHLLNKKKFKVFNHDEKTINQLGKYLEATKIQCHINKPRIYLSTKIFPLQGRFQIDCLETISKHNFQKLHVDKKLLLLFNCNKIKQLIHSNIDNCFTYVCCNDIVQFKYSNIIGKALETAEDIYNKGLLFESVGIANANWQKIRGAMLQGIHLNSSQESYKIYFQVALVAECVISLCYPRISKDLFRGCLDYSYLFGNREEQALMMAIYGRSLTAYPEAGGYKEAMQYYTKALPILKARHLQYRTLLLYTSMGFNCYMQGKYSQAIRYSREGLCLTVEDQDSKDVHHATANCALVLAYNLSYQGNYSLVEELLMSTLDVVGDTGHPSVSIMLNTLGLNAERNGNQTAKALKYYLASLFERRKTACINSEKLVVPLCNVGKLLSGIQGKHSAALRLLKEAQSIRRSYGKFHHTSSLILKYMSEVYKRQNLMEESIAPLLEALDVYQQINADLNLIVALLSDIAHSYLITNKQRHAMVFFQKILNAKNRILALRPDNTHVASSLEHIVRLSTESQEVQKYYVEDLLAELKRLSQIRELRRVQKTKYLTQIGNYSYTLLLMENRISMQENQPGLSIESIPGICLLCQQYMSIGQYTKPAYLKLVCSLSNGVS
ncbi:uncharacterized protein LOC115232051 [Argonauta hians]